MKQGIKGSFLVFIVIGLLFSFQPAPTAFKKKAQIALVVDFSKSTQEISDAVRSNYWEIYNEFNDKYPDTELEIAVVGFSSKAFGSKSGYVKLLSNFNDDPQDFYNYINTKKLSSSVAENNVGKALTVAVSDLKWDENPDVKKQIFAMGNGPIKDSYSQAKRACKKAEKLQISVNCFYIVYKQKDKNFSYWRYLTQLSHGQLETIVPKYLNGRLSGPVQMNTKRINEECELMNSTYVFYGPKGAKEFEKMRAVDAQTQSFGEKVAGNRSLYKSTDYFQKRQTEWDLVDRFKWGTIDYKKLQKAHLPEEYKNMNTNELKALLKTKSEERQGYLDVIRMLDYTNKKIQEELPKPPAYSLDLSSTIIKVFSESGI